MRIKAVLAGSALLGLVFLGPAAGVMGLDNPHWSLKLTAGPAIINHKDYNIEYLITSQVAADRFSIELYQGRDTLPISTAKTNKDFSESGLFTVSTNSDGDYIYHIKAINLANNETQTADSKVTIDTIAPPKASKLVVTPDGANYQIEFSIDPNQGITQFLIYGSKSSYFKLSAETFVAKQTVTMPAEIQQFNYMSNDKGLNYFAVIVSDKAGNNSTAAVVNGTSVDDSAVINDGSISYAYDSNPKVGRSAFQWFKDLVKNVFKKHWEIVSVTAIVIILAAVGLVQSRNRRLLTKKPEPIDMDIDF